MTKIVALSKVLRDRSAEGPNWCCFGDADIIALHFAMPGSWMGLAHLACSTHHAAALLMRSEPAREASQNETDAHWLHHAPFLLIRTNPELIGKQDGK